MTDVFADYCRNNASVFKVQAYLSVLNVLM